MTSNTSHHLDSLKNMDLDDSTSDDIEWMDKWVIRFIKAVAITLAVLVVGGCFSVVVPIGKYALTYEKTPDSSTSKKARTSAPTQVSGKSKQDDSGSNEGSNEPQSQQNGDEGSQQGNNPDDQNQNNSESEHDYTEDLKSAGGEIGNNLKKAGEQAVNKGKQAGKSAGEWLRQKWNSAGESGQNGNSSNQNQDENEQSAETNEGSSEDKPAPQNDSSQNQ